MSETFDLNEMRVFSAVATRRSFVGASRALGMPKATVSRKVQALEERLGVRLLQRTTRRVTVTEVGAVFQERCARIEEEIADAEAAVGRYSDRPRGTLRVTAPYTLARDALVPWLPEFVQRYPEVRVWLTLKNEPEDLVGRGADVALTPWPLADSSHAARRVASSHSALFASPGYLERRGTPRAPEDLSGHGALLYAGGGQPPRFEWTLSRGARVATVPLAPVLVCNDLSPLVTAAIGGAGVLLALPASVPDAVRARRLVPVLPAWTGPTVEIRAVFPARAGLPPKVRVFLDFLADEVGPRLEAGRGARRRDG
ncbi:MAG TPA: LysR family transcriptional regulator [Anaeromyxobacteraceae bacterium]|nr:LysR family transcriptional regulator [Anaeromyxobacteraceae bacterium]